MLNKTIKTDKYGNKVVDYRITKGDTFIQNIQLTKGEEVIGLDTVERIEFRLGTDAYVEVLNQDYSYLDSVKKFKISLNTIVLTEGETYRYQVIVYYTSGIQNMISGGKFTVTDLIEEE